MSVVVAIGEPTSVRLPSTTAPALKSISRTTCLDKENINPVTGLACDNVRAGKKRKSKGDQIAFVEGSKSKKLKSDALQCKGLLRSRFALAAKFPVRSVGVPAVSPVSHVDVVRANTRCYELTVSPLADVSEAYRESPLALFAVFQD